MSGSLIDRKKVLVIAYGFPPVGGSTSIRVLKFCKYLPQFSWQPVVITVKEPRTFELDPSLLEELPGEIEIHRTPSIELPSFLYKTQIISGGKYRISSYFYLKRFLGKVFKILRYMFLVIDERIGWVPFTVFRGYRLIRKKRIKIIYVVVKPFSSLIAAILLKRISNLLLVIDFHDAWTTFNPYFWSEKPAYLRYLEKTIEEAAIRNANKIISVNENIIKDFRSKYPQYPADKFVSICNGYDSDDFMGPAPALDKNIFSITYTGSLYPKRSPENFLSALGLLLKEKPSLKERIRFCYIGKITIANQRFFNNSNLKDIIELPGMLSHKECIMRIRKSDLLLFIEDQVEISEMLLPTKIFEYVASGRPILALAKNGLASNLIRESKSGVVLENEDILAIKDKLLEFIKDGAEAVDGLKLDKAAIAHYSQETASNALARVFNDLFLLR